MHYRAYLFSTLASFGAPLGCGSSGGDTTSTSTSNASTSGESSTATGPTSSAGTDTSATDSHGGTTTGGVSTVTASTADPTENASTSGDASTSGGVGTSGDMSTSGDTSTSDGSTSGEPLEIPDWLLSINNSTRMLQKISTKDATTVDLCKLSSNDPYPSLTFSRDNLLYASRSGTALEIIDPCTCKVTQIGSYGNGLSGVNGITSDQGNGLYGAASTQDVLITIDVDVGKATLVGPLGVNFGSSGATWSDSIDDLYSIDATSDTLYRIDHVTGKASSVAKLNVDFSSVGIEVHPGDGVIYACTGTNKLFTVNPKNGEIGTVGAINQTSCSNLAAPWQPIACIP